MDPSVGAIRAPCPGRNVHGTSGFACAAMRYDGGVGGRRVRVFHISDLHMRSVDGPQGARERRDAAFRWRVLRQKWKDNLAELRKDGIPSIWSCSPAT